LLDGGSEGGLQDAGESTRTVLAETALPGRGEAQKAGFWYERKVLDSIVTLKKGKREREGSNH